MPRFLSGRTKLLLPRLLVVLTLHACTSHPSASHDSSRSATANPPAPPSGASSSGSSQTASAPAPTSIAVAGTLALDATGQSGGVPVDLNNRKVQLIDDQGSVLGEGMTNPQGAFTLAIQAGDLQLTGTMPGAPSTLATLKTIFLSPNGADQGAIGTQQSLLIDGKALEVAADGSAVFDSGTHKVKKIGAIFGTVQLETGEDPSGIDVYVPGSTYVAKTDAQGLFLLGFMPPGTYTLRADKVGYGSLEWAQVTVKRGETTHIGGGDSGTDPVVMEIATGPKIESFALDTGAAIAAVAGVNLTLHLKGTTKFRVSQLADFRDTVYRPAKAGVSTLVVPFQISGQDGPKQIYLEVADSDGLTASATLDVLLDTTAPVVPAFICKSTTAQAGYSDTLAPLLTVSACSTAVKLFLTESSSAPVESQFNINCSDAAGAGATVSLSSGDGVKNLHLWALDAGSRISTAGSAGQVTLITTPPTVTVSQDSGLYNDIIALTASAGANTHTYYTFDQSDPTPSSSEIVGKLVLVGNTTLKFRAYDFAGNMSPVLSRTYTIKRDAPILGSVKLNGYTSPINRNPVPLSLSAQGATKMIIAENYAALSAAITAGSWLAYSPTYSYTLSGTADGSKALCVAYSDDAYNILGKQCDIAVRFLLKRAVPNVAITLLQPESPTGAFNTPLAWQTTSSDPTISYQVEVFDNNTYTGTPVVPMMATNLASIRITPPLSSPGKYYWRVRAVDDADNQTEWVPSGDSKSFIAKILDTSYQSRRDFTGANGADTAMARTLVSLGDINNDTNHYPEIAYSILSSSASLGASSCNNCGVVKVFNPDPAVLSTLATLTELTPSNWYYGHRVLGCDLLGTGTPQIVVSAPGAPALQTFNSIQYFSTGAVYVYDPTTFQRLAVFHESVSPDSFGNVAGYYQNMDCSNPATGCVQVYGNSYLWVSALDTASNLPWGNGRYFGWDLACADGHAGGARKSLLVGEPGYFDAGSSMTVGRVVELAMDNNDQLVQTSTVTGPTDQDNSAFGAAVQYFSALVSNTAGATANCSTTSPLKHKIVVGRPRKNVVSSWDQTGSFSVYYDNGSSWSNCATVDALSTDPSNLGFGYRLKNLGNFGAASPATDVLAVSGANWGGSVMRLYGSSSGAQLKSYKDTSPNSGLGYDVAVAGDIGGTGQTKIAVGAPQMNVKGKWGAGATYIFRYGDLNNSDDASASPFLSITGTPQNNANLGAGFVPVLASSDPTRVPPIMLISSPARMNSTWNQVGGFGVYAKIKLGTFTPFKIVGTSPNGLFGHSISVPRDNTLAAVDLDNDTIPDVVLGAPKGKCAGRPFGKASLYSVLSGEMTTDFCGLNSFNMQAGDGLGNGVFTLPFSSNMMFAGKYALYSVPYSNFLTSTDFANAASYSSGLVSMGGTVVAAASTPTRLYGSGTNFSTSFRYGDYIYFDSGYYKVVSVQSDNLLTVSSSVGGGHTFAGLVYGKNGVPSTAAGTVTVSSGSQSAVVGSGTGFLALFSAGDAIYVGGETRAVASVVDNTNLTVTKAFSSTYSGATFIQSNGGAFVAPDELTVVHGLRSHFTTTFAVGDGISLGGEFHTIKSIQSDDQMTVTTVFSSPQMGSGSSFSYSSGSSNLAHKMDIPNIWMPYQQVSEPLGETSIWADEFLLAAAPGSGTGRVTRVKHNWSGFQIQCYYQLSTFNNDLFGASATFISDLTADGAPEIVIGAPGINKVFVVDGSTAPGDCVPDSSGTPPIIVVDGNTTAARPYTLFTINGGTDSAITAAAPAGLGAAGANANFGAYVYGLPSFGAASTQAYLHVANNNIAQGTSTAVSQYLIFAINFNSASRTLTNLKLVTFGTGVASEMLGGYAKLIEDVDEHGQPELAISDPGGIGVYGNTGQVRILSGELLGVAAQTTASSYYLQMLYNPDPGVANFGSAVDYADFNGDGIKDFIVGADAYNTSSYQNAGAVYVFPVRPIQDQ